MKVWASSFFAAVALLGAAVRAQEDKRPTGETYEQILTRLGDGMRENIAIRGEHDSRTDGRKHNRFYTDLQPLTDFSPYRPVAGLAGTIRISGLYLHDGLIKDQWIAAFQRFHPLVKVVITQKGTIASGAVDIETGPRISDRLRAASQYERATGERLFEIDWATGSYNVPGWSPAFAIFVHKDNPIAGLTITQLDGIFGGARTGGWKGTRWDPTVARGPEKNIRTWGQLGLKGEWANKPIHVLGYTLNFHFPRDFAEKVMGGGYMWNENMVEYSNVISDKPGEFGKLKGAGDLMMEDLAKDKYAITYAMLQPARWPDAKTVPLARTAAGPFIMPSLDSVQARTYPLTREVYYYADRKPGVRIDPLVAEYLRFVTSSEGQALIMKDGKYLPLTAEAARAQLTEIDRVGSASTGDGG